MIRDFSSGKGGCVLKHPNHPVNCVQEIQLWKGGLCNETPYLCCQLYSGISALESVAVFWNTLTILSTVFRGSSSGKGDFIVKHPLILSTVFKNFQLWKWQCSKISERQKGLYCRLVFRGPTLERWRCIFVKHPICPVNCVQGIQLWNGAVLWNTLIMLSTVFRDSSTGKGKLCCAIP